MCGILGQIKLQNDILRDTNKFVRSLNLLTHRGPDDSGIFVDENYIFGHRRLSIIDLSSSAKQPMFTNDEKVIIIFNGEIYNYKELKEDLIKEGYSFRTNSDTEVLLNGYHCFGMKFINRCIGMFAFAIYDKRINKSFIVRDRLGIKPLYFCEKNGRLTFSSEIKSILAFENISKELNLDAVSSYLSFRYPVLNDTFFKGIYSLQPGHYIEIENGKISTNKYWDPSVKFEEQEIDKGESYYIEELRSILQSSIQYRMISDVPIGTLLSGGIDSSVITAIMAEKSRSPIKTYTIGYDEEGYNEFNFAKMTSTKYQTDHHEIKSDVHAYFERLDKLIGFKDAPLSIPNEVAQYELATELKKDITVVLAGTGADEIFCGYGRIFRSVYDYERLHEFNSIIPQNKKESFYQNFQDKYSKIDFPTELSHFMAIYSYTSLEKKKDLLHKSIDLVNKEQKLEAKIQEYFNSASSGRYIDKMSYAFLKLHLPGILHHNDVTSMAASVELRVPYLDHRLVEFAFSVPIHYKLRWKSNNSKLESIHLMSDEISEQFDTPKYLLKKAYEAEVPQEVLYRKKIGFPVPLHVWLGGNFKPFIRDVLLSAKARNRKIYNTENLKKWFDMDIIQQHKGDSRTYQHSLAGKIWMLLNLEKFLQKYFD